MPCWPGICRGGPGTAGKLLKDPAIYDEFSRTAEQRFKGADGRDLPNGRAKGGGGPPGKLLKIESQSQNGWKNWLAKLNRPPWTKMNQFGAGYARAVDG